MVENTLLRDFAPHHVSIAVTDMDRALAWYHAVLGFQTEARYRVEGIPADGAFMKGPGLRLELWCADGVAPVPAERRTPNQDLKTAGTKHLAFTVPDLQGCLAGLLAQGVDIAAVQRDPSEPMLAEANPLAAGLRPAFSIFIRDPFGTLIELLDRARATTS